MEKFPENQESSENSPKIKEEVDYIFAHVPDLESVGTKEEYARYLETVFPNSKVKNVVWHGSPEQFSDYDAEKIGNLDGGFFGKGFYFSETKSLAEHYQKRYGKSGALHAQKINLLHPYEWKDNQRNFNYVDFMDLKNTPKGDILINQDYEPGWENELVERYNSRYGEHISRLSDLEYADELRRLGVVGTEFLKEKGYDGSIATNPLSKEIEYVAFGTDQIHILGSERDLGKFRAFVNNEKSTNDSPASV